jgi:hypothetical protein
MTDQPFALSREAVPVPPERWRPEAREGTQRVLFCGLECLPGQLDLFTTDGPTEEKPCTDNPSTFP